MEGETDSEDTGTWRVRQAQQADRYVEGETDSEDTGTWRVRQTQSRGG